MTDLDAGQVECYSGYTYAQEPRTVVWQGRRYPVLQVERRWQTPEGRVFCVGTETGERFQLHYHQIAHLWTIEPLPHRVLTPDPPESATQTQPVETKPVSPNNHNQDQEVPI